MADVQVPSIAVTGPDAGDTVVGVKGGLVKRFSLSGIASAIASVIPFARTGGVTRTLSAKALERVSVEDFGAVLDGVVDDTAAIQAAIAGLLPGQTLRGGPGTAKISASLDFSAMPEGAGVDFEFEIDATGVADAVIVAGLFKVIRLNKITGTTGAACKVYSAANTVVRIKQIQGFATGLHLIGQYGHAGGNGILFCTFDVERINVTGDCLYMTTVASGTGGYINENYFYLKFLNGARGVVAVKGAGQTDRFNGNKFVHCGFENITGDAVDLAFTAKCKIDAPRFENVGGYQIVEAADCNRNLYVLSYSATLSKLSFSGLLAQVIGEIVDGTGLTLSQQAVQTDTGEMIYFAPEYSSSLSPRTLAWQDSFDEIFRDRIELKDASGAKKIIRMTPDNSQQTVGVGASTINHGITLIKANSGGGAVTITMPVTLEQNGHSLLLNVAVYSGSITVKKSTGASTAAAGITGTGLYTLAYMDDQWLVSPIGSALGA